MKNSIRNTEGYIDIVPYEVVKKIEQKRKFRPLVYICSPYSGDVEKNIEKAKMYCRFAVVKGQIPLAPHLMFPQFMNDDSKEERELALFMDIVLIGKCQEMWVFGEKYSEGMRREIVTAKKQKKKIRFFDEKCEVIKIWN